MDLEVSDTDTYDVVTRFCKVCGKLVSAQNAVYPPRQVLMLLLLEHMESHGFDPEN